MGIHSVQTKAKPRDPLPKDLGPSPDLVLSLLRAQEKLQAQLGPQGAHVAYNSTSEQVQSASRESQVPRIGVQAGRGLGLPGLQPRSAVARFCVCGQVSFLT